MTDTKNLPQHSANPLIPALLDTIHVARERADELHEVREAYLTAVAMLADGARENDRLREQNIFLRAQLRAVMNGTTIAAERQQAEADAIAAWATREAA